MEDDDQAHTLCYRVLGISEEEGRLIDVYQNKGRFLYKYAGSFLEDAAKECFKDAFPEAARLRIPNTVSNRPKTFEIDCLIEETRAHEIKWRDATTDGDHISKEHDRVRAIRDAGYTPIRVMFFEPNRDQAQRIQARVRAVYQEVGGEYYSGDAAWDYLRAKTGTDLRELLTDRCVDL